MPGISWCRMIENLCPKCKDVLAIDARACACGWRKDGRKADTEIDRTCPWNDHGSVCGVAGSLSDSTNGAGPWYCAPHYWKLKGFPIQKNEVPLRPYRERWFAVRGLDYEPPRKGNLKDIAPRLREPGDDDQEVAA